MPLLLLDLDNTLLDRAGGFAAWASRAAGQWAPRDRDAAVRFLLDADADGVRPRAEFFELVREQFGLRASVDSLIEKYRRGTLAVLPPVAAGVGEGLRGLRDAGWRLAVVSNGDAIAQRAKVERAGLVPLLDACVISGAVGIRKPDPRIFEIAAAECDESLRGAWVIGDGEVDVLGAAAVGARSIWLTRGREWPREDVVPDATADTLLAALALLA